MTKHKNLQKRGNVYYGRVAVPKPLRELRKSAGQCNPAEIVRSLRTSDRKTAERLLPSFLDQAYRDFERNERQLREQGLKPQLAPTAEDLAGAREKFFCDELNRDELQRTSRKSHTELEKLRGQLSAQLEKDQPGTSLDLICVPGYLEYQVAGDAADISSERRGVLQGEIRKHLAESNYVLVADVIEDYSRSNGLAIKPVSRRTRQCMGYPSQVVIGPLRRTRNADVYRPRRSSVTI